jgi:hypothetical protein
MTKENWSIVTLRVGIAKVGGKFVYNFFFEPFVSKTSSPDPVPPMNPSLPKESLSPVEAILQELQEPTEELLRELTQLLQDTPDEKLFGETEFLVRDKVLQLVSRLYQARLNQKKTATQPADSTVPIANK